jgi:hypothetical protein
LAKNVSRQALLARRGRTPARIAAAIANRSLTFQQRLAIHALTQTVSNKEALELLAQNGVLIDKSTLSRWTKLPSFRRAREAAEEVIADTISKKSVLRKSEALLEKAMEGTPILGYVGKDLQEIVGYKSDLPTAARVLELQGRAVGLFQDDDAARVGVLIDIDFSGRKGEPVAQVKVDPPKPPPPAPVLDAEFTSRLLEQHLSADDWLE